MYSIRGMILSAILVCMLAPYLLLAQEGDAKPQQERRGPLPTFFGKLGVGDDQREKMYALQNEYEKKLKPLRDEIKKLIAERDQKLEDMLTEGQKLRLSELKQEAKERSRKPLTDQAQP